MSNKTNTTTSVSPEEMAKRIQDVGLDREIAEFKKFIGSLDINQKKKLKNLLDNPQYSGKTPVANEKDRLDFITKRDGQEAMLKFAEQGLALYVAQSIDRSQYKESIEEYKHVLENAGKTVKIVVVE